MGEQLPPPCLPTATPMVAGSKIQFPVSSRLTEFSTTYKQWLNAKEKNLSTPGEKFVRLSNFF